MANRRPAGTKAAMILPWLKEHPNSTTGEIAEGIDWTVQRVSTALWVMFSRTPAEVVRVSRIVPGRKTPTWLYSCAESAVEPLPKVISRIVPTVDLLPGPVVCVPEPVRDDPVTHMFDNWEGKKATPPQNAVAPPREGKLDTLVEELARSIAQHVLSRVEAQLAAQLGQILPRTTQPLTPISVEALTARLLPVEHADTKRPTVLIAGLLPSQAGVIQQEFHDVFDLRFYMVEENLSRLRDMLPGAQHVFTFTSKISHKVEETMKSFGVTIHRCSGGMTMLKEQLLNLYVSLGDSKK